MSNQKAIVSNSVNIAPPASGTGVSESTMLQMEIVVFPYDASKAAARTENLLRHAASGKPLRRSRDLNDLAAKASALRGRKPTYAQSWASKLAASLTSFND